MGDKLGTREFNFGLKGTLTLLYPIEAMESLSSLLASVELF